MLLSVFVKTLEVALPLESALLCQDVLEEDLSPLGVGNPLSNFLQSLSSSQFLDVQISRCFNITSQFLVSFVVVVVDWTAFEADDSCESVVIGNGSRGSHFSTKSMTSNSGHRDLLLVHEPDDVI